MLSSSRAQLGESYVLDHALPKFIRENIDLYLGSLAAVDRVDEWDRTVSGHSDAINFFLGAQFKALWSKNHVRPYEGDLQEEAIEAFWSCEEKTHVINQSLLKFGIFHFGADASILSKARELIHKAIGSHPLTLGGARITTGASVSTKRSSSTVLHKIQDGICATPACLDYVIGMQSVDEWPGSSGWPYLFEALMSNGVRLVDGNVFHTVPKQWNKLRPIATEPSLNGFLQTSIAARLKTALRRSFSVNIDRQQKRHAFLIREHAKSIATIDLSSASDLISFEVVRFLFEGTPIWDALQASRSPCTELPKDSIISHVALSKFASMGNGCTFELETLIFAAIQRACFDERRYDKELLRYMGTYGDDMIVPRNLASTLIRVLEKCGFIINKDKSFVDGPFKESCGVDFYDSVDVRPLFFRYGTESDGIHGLANTYAMVWYPLELSMRLYGCIAKELLEISRQALKFIPIELQFFGPLLYNEGEYRFLHTNSWLPEYISHYARSSTTCISAQAIALKVDNSDVMGNYRDFLAYNEYRLSKMPVFSTCCKFGSVQLLENGTLRVHPLELRRLAVSAQASLDESSDSLDFTKVKGLYSLHSTSKVLYRLTRQSKKTLNKLVHLHRTFGGLKNPPIV